MRITALILLPLSATLLLAAPPAADAHDLRFHTTAHVRYHASPPVHRLHYPRWLRARHDFHRWYRLRQRHVRGGWSWGRAYRMYLGDRAWHRRHHRRGYCELRDPRRHRYRHYDD